MTGMLNFLQTVQDREAQPPSWINWRRNQSDPPAVQQSDPDPPEERRRTVHVKETRPYVAMGHDPVNKDGRICNCGSNTHLTKVHNMCPLNDKFWPGLPQTADRLKLYVPREIWQWWRYDDGTAQKCKGRVTNVGANKLIHIEYEDGGSEDCSEQMFLAIVAKMKKTNAASRKRQRKSNDKGRRTRRR